uniref:Nucleolar 27S pre-rRNA processing Urb2/Npa2 C-terminal domain-containing protein n=1 Tax=Kwoniella dejecticola CBS 10117 TaxID=1296121 RepID=A0A1A5ZVZ8_9TREE|nr:uncharacterized protein I303_07896 [Kwoniella dejecticola CBS 10117]OBR81983.1 hypothetical protein I303_07896 [Kwoniella dejecticola CBS 10117]
MAALLFQHTLLPPSRDTMQPILSQLSTPGSLLVLPALFASLVQILHQHRYPIFTQASSSKIPHDVFVASKEREAVRLVLSQILARLYEEKRSPTLCHARLALWKTVQLWGGYMERESAWGQMIRAEALLAEQSLCSGDSALVGPLLEIFSTLENLDHDQTQIGTSVIRWCLACPPDLRTIASALLCSLIRYHQLTHTLPSFFDLLLQSLNGLYLDSIAEDTIISLYNVITAGPLSDDNVRRNAIQSLRSSNIGKARSTAWDHVCTSFVNLLSSKLVPSVVDQKKRKRPTPHASHSAALVGTTTRLLQFCLAAAAGTAFDTDPPHDAIAKLLSLVQEWPSPPAENSISWSAAVIEAGRLRTVQAMERLLARRFPAVEVASFYSSSQELTLEEVSDPMKEIVADDQIRFTLHRGILNGRLSPDTIDWLLNGLVNASTAVWQVTLEQGLPLIDISATSIQLQKLADLICRKCDDDPAFLSISPVWELAHLKGAVQAFVNKGSPEYPLLNICPPAYLDKKIKLDMIGKTRDVSVAAGWLNRTASEADTIGLMSRNMQLLRQLVIAATSDDGTVIDLFSKVMRFLALAPDQNGKTFSTIIGELAAIGDTHLIAEFFAVIIAKRPESFASLHEELVDLSTAAGDEAKQTDAFDVKALRSRNLLLQAKRWLGVPAQEIQPLRQSICKAFFSGAFPGDRSAFARTVLETIAAESVDASHVIATALVMYSRYTDLELDSTLHEVLEGSIDQAISLCCATSPSPAHLRLLTVMCGRCNNVEILQRAVRTALAATSDDIAIIDFLERIVEEKASILHHDDIVQILGLTTHALVASKHVLSPSINLLSSLSRRRPDLILANLPDLVDVIALMFIGLQMRRDLTAPSSTDAQPLSRLLVILTQMRPKGHEISPLAKHAPAILVAYTRAAADSQSGFAPQVRRDLEPGLFGLCNLATAGGRVHAHGREGEGLGTPFGLGEGPGGEGEKELWAELWRSWSRARYLGQG